MVGFPRLLAVRGGQLSLVLVLVQLAGLWIPFDLAPQYLLIL